MKKLVSLCTVIVLCAAQIVLADNENEKGKDKDKGKKVPPGLEKKGGVPPGQARKQNQPDGSAPESAPAVATPAPATTPVTPGAAPAPVKPAANEPAKGPTTVKTDAKAPSAKPATLAEQKATLDKHMRVINQAAKSSPAMEKAALQQISKETGVPIEQLQQQEKYHPEVSPTALLVGNLIAKQSGKRFGEVLRERQGGKHWAEVAKAHNVDMDPINQKAAHLLQTLQSAKR